MLTQVFISYFFYIPYKQFIISTLALGYGFQKGGRSKFAALLPQCTVEYNQP